jgi:3-deoxy-manno-octulosonate cytidylyltransferase (CMP-KDO synthetase)
MNKLNFIIPARMESSRLPGKVLEKIGDKSMLDWVYRNCAQSAHASDVIVGTDSAEIEQHCHERGFKVTMTGAHNCCSNRSAEVADSLDSEWIVEVQSDEPFLWASIVDQWLDRALAAVRLNENVDVVLSRARIPSNVAHMSKFVKMVISPTGAPMWASRSRIPSDYKIPVPVIWGHMGLYLWRRKSLIKFASIEPGPIEKSEDTHALRIWESGMQPLAIEIEKTQGVDVPEDLEMARLYAVENKVEIAKRFTISGDSQ